MYSPLVPNDEEVVAILRSGKNVVTPVGWVYPDLSNPRHKAIADAARRSRGDPARVGNPSRRHHRAISAHAVLAVVGGHPRARRGVLRHPHLQRPGRRAPHHGVRRHPRGSHAGAHGQPARGGLQAVGANDRRPHGISHRSQHQDHPGCRRGDLRHRLRPVPDHHGYRGRAPVPLASARRRRAGHHGGGQLADGRGRTWNRPGISVGAANASRSRSPATPP